jgi:hypothetical protein
MKMKDKIIDGLFFIATGAVMLWFFYFLMWF